MKYLFVGGHNNGKRIELPDNPPPRIVMPVYPSEPSKYDAPAEYFEAIPFEAEGGRFIVYAIYGMSPLQVLEALIEKYPAPTPAATADPATAAELADLITNAVDEAIRKGTCSSYDDWQTLIYNLLAQHAPKSMEQNDFLKVFRDVKDIILPRKQQPSAPPEGVQHIGVDMGTGESWTAEKLIKLCNCGKPCYRTKNGVLLD